MRISDWSSDVCSSDLQHQSRLVLRQNINAVQLAQGHAQGEFMGGCVGGPLVCRDIRGIDGAVARLPISRLARCMIAQAKRLLHLRSDEHTSELQSLIRISYDVFCLKAKTQS